MGMQGRAPWPIRARIVVSDELVRAVAEAVLPVLPVLREATPTDDALRLGRRGLQDPFTPDVTGRPAAVPDVLYPVLAGLELTPPDELLAHRALSGLDRGLIEEKLAEHRHYRELRESGSPPTAVWERVEPGSRPPPPPPDPLDGPRGLVGALTDALGTHPWITAVVAGDGGSDTEPEMAARRGATLVGVGLAAATLVQRTIPGLGTDRDLAGLLGWTGFARAGALLDELGAPPGYDAAVRAEHARDYTLPRAAAADLTSPSGHLALVEGYPAAVRAARLAGDGTLADLLPSRVPDFSANGLVTVTDGVLQVRTREPYGRCEAGVEVVAATPGEVDTAGWDEVVETTWTATEGLAVLVGDPTSPWGVVGVQTPPGPGPYRVRVHAVRPSTRRGEPGPERYRLVVWQAPAGPDVAHRLTDELGRQLRGEPEPRRPEGPVSASWISYDDPAAITVVTGSPGIDEVAAAFGADPAAPVVGAQAHDPDLYSELVIVQAVGDVVLVVEPNGFRTLHEDVVERLCRGGRRMATWFWNVNALTRLVLAEDGVVLAGFEPGFEPDPDHPALAHLWADLDFEDFERRADNVLSVIEGFTGFRWTREDYWRALDTERAFVADPR